MFGRAAALKNIVPHSCDVFYRSFEPMTDKVSSYFKENIRTNYFGLIFNNRPRHSIMHSEIKLTQQLTVGNSKQFKIQVLAEMPFMIEKNLVQMFS